MIVLHGFAMLSMKCGGGDTVDCPKWWPPGLPFLNLNFQATRGHRHSGKRSGYPSPSSQSPNHTSCCIVVFFSACNSPSGALAVAFCWPRRGGRQTHVERLLGADNDILVRLNLIIGTKRYYILFYVVDFQICCCVHSFALFFSLRPCRLYPPPSLERIMYWFLVELCQRNANLATNYVVLCHKLLLEGNFGVVLDVPTRISCQISDLVHFFHPCYLEYIIHQSIL